MWAPSSRLRVALVVLVAASVALAAHAAREQVVQRDRGVAVVPPATRGSPPPARSAFAHLRAFQRIADRNGGNRAAGTAGDRASLGYVADRLRAAGYRVSEQRVRFPFFQERGAPRLSLGDRRLPGIRTLAYSPGGRASGPVREVGSGSDAGCGRADFAGFPRGAVAVIARGTCRMRRKVDNAARAGAVAAVIFNDGGPGRTGTIAGSLVGPGARIPALFATHATGRRLAEAEGRRAAVGVRAVSERRTTRNLVAELRGGAGRDVVMAGAHIDSVAEGAGINDNASGSAALLAAAEDLAAERDSRRKLRFAFWGAEEVGLIGSRAYVRGLDGGQRRRIRAYLNLDMIGSPRAGRFVYASDDERGRELAALARRVLARRGVGARDRGLGGGSDHAPFQRAGVPIVGLFSGAGEPYDPCYHRRCDRLAGIDRAALAELGDGARDILQALARGA